MPAADQADGTELGDLINFVQHELEQAEARARRLRALRDFLADAERAIREKDWG